MIIKPEEVARRLQTIEEVAAFYEGAKHCLHCWAYWKDGEQYVGSCGRRYHDEKLNLMRDEIAALEIVRRRLETQIETINKIRDML